ncbi:MAG TPA: HEPN domain-containing protein [Anaerolineae bacterium]|nr:HEPN domain-containing protein [Anaerolineae bacterium]
MRVVESLFDQDEFFRWMRQAEHTLTSAQRDAAEGDYSWACFKAQQAAEYAAKALLRGLGLPAFGHSILRGCPPTLWSEWRCFTPVTSRLWSQRATRLPSSAPS